MTLPTIHLNGTSRESLLDGYCRAAGALRDAINTLIENASPNGRDYYTQGPDAMPQAQKEHQARVDRLVEVRKELEALAEYVADAPGGRR